MLICAEQSTRLPYQDVLVSTEGQEHVPSVVGPMARSVSSLIRVMEAVIGAEPWRLDPKVAPIPWRRDPIDEIRNRKLVIGVMRDDGVVRVHPPIARVLDEAARKLEAAGHEIVEWMSDGHADAIAVMVFIFNLFAELQLITNNRMHTTLPTVARMSSALLSPAASHLSRT